MLGQVRLFAAWELRRRCRWLNLLRSKETREGGYGAEDAFRIGADASCSDGACGHSSRIIVNPAEESLVVPRG
jgi:hypothetical protein